MREPAPTGAEVVPRDGESGWSPVELIDPASGPLLSNQPLKSMHKMPTTDGDFAMGD